MLTAFAFLCAATAVDCEHEAKISMRIGEGSTPFACFQDAYQGVARASIEPEDGEQLVIKCRRAGRAD